MNISHENKVIWWALEESGEDEMSKILKNYGFYTENDLLVILNVVPVSVKPVPA